MMRYARIGGGLLVAVLLAVAATAWVDWAVGAGRPGIFEPFAAKGKNKAQPATPGVANQGFFGDDIEKINATCELTEAQKTRLMRMKDDRDKALEKYDKESAIKLALMEGNMPKPGPTNKNAPKAPDASKQLAAVKAQMAAERENMVQTYTRNMFAVLNADQKAKWNTPLLNEGMTKEFSVVMLEPKQIEKLDAFCAQQAKGLTFPVDPFSPEDKKLNPLKLQVYNTILTPAQQAEYRKIKTPTPPPAKNAKNAKAAGQA